MKTKLLLILVVFFLSVSVKTVDARSGCCSHHGGVSGCRCGDGSALSSTCAPYYPECNGSQTVKKTVTQYIRPTVIPTRRPTVIPTNKPIPTHKPTIIPTEGLLTPETIHLQTSTEKAISELKLVSETKGITQQNIFSRLLSWLFGNNK